MQTNQQALHDLMNLLPIDGPPAGESKIAAYLRQQLRTAGLPESAFDVDNAHRQSEYDGDTGNLIVRFDGHGRGERLLLSAHMDTVPNCVGCKPRLDQAAQIIVNDAPDRALGGDNRTGCALLLAAARALLARKGDHGPVTLIFLIQEEVGLVGARGMEVSRLGTPAPTQCINFDSYRADRVITAVTGAQRMGIKLKGIASHAGSEPAKGVSCAIIAARAISELDREGWHGKIDRPEGDGRANIGVQHGGEGSNVVMPAMEILAEARSFNPAFRAAIIARFRKAFTDAAASVTNDAGKAGLAEFTPGPTYEAYELPDSHPLVQRVFQIARDLDIPMQTERSHGGVDANWIMAHGIPAVTLGSGMRQVHSVNEWIDLTHFHQACRIVERICATH